MLTTKLTPVIILGMHRSGTSCLAGSLQEAGVFFGDVSKSNTYNTKGNRENDHIMELNNDLLYYNNASWENPPQQSISWNRYFEKRAQEIIHTFESTTDTNYWGFKDPRTLLTIAFWEEILPQAMYIGTFREPIQVATSLRKRNTNFSLSEGLELWHAYNSLLLKAVKSKSIPLISFDLSGIKYIERISQLFQQFNLPRPNNNSFFEAELRSPKNQQTNLIISPEILECYHQLLKYSNSYIGDTHEY